LSFGVLSPRKTPAKTASPSHSTGGVQASRVRLALVKRITGDGVELAVLDEGEGHPVLLLHGFPDSSHLWRHQVPALVEAGFRAIAPDLRGFGQSDKPEAVEDYTITRSLEDLRALLDALGIERAHVVGHDFGAALAGVAAALAPERVERLVVLSVGHPNATRERSIDAR
jgi:pimeloyl-ACP methyl ester carboxylesterase